MKLKDVLDAFDQQNGNKLDIHQVYKEISSVSPEESDSTGLWLQAELLAFNFNETGIFSRTSNLETYFGPRITLQNENGGVIEFPSVQSITCDMIIYWNKRSDEVINPILKARYIGLIIEFSYKVCDTKPIFKKYVDYINALIGIANSDIYTHEVYVFHKLSRALYLAINLNNSSLVDECKKEIINYQNKIFKNSKGSHWKYKYDLLMQNKKVQLSNDEVSDIIEELEAILVLFGVGIEGEVEVDPWAVESAAKRLATYYRKKGSTEDVKRVLVKVGEAFEKIINNGSPLQVNGWLENLHKLYMEFNLKEEAEKLLIRIRMMGSDTLDEMKEFSHTFTVSKSMIKDYVDAITSGSSEEVLNLIAINHIPSKSDAKIDIETRATQTPLPYLLTTKLQDESGRVVASIGPLSEDMEGHIIRQISLNINYTSFLLRDVMERIISERLISTSDVIEFIKKSPLFLENRLVIIRSGLDSYFSGDFLIFTHLIIPQIEEAARKIIEIAGGNTYKKPRVGDYFHVKTFDDILRDSLLLDSLGEDIVNYMRVLYTDPRGWNLRNDVCHGLAELSAFNSMTADRILHSMLCLGLVRLNEK